MPIVLFLHGTGEIGDDIVPASESEIAVESLRGFGGDVKFTLYPEARHDAWTENTIAIIKRI